MRVVFDLDGVLRDLSGTISREAGIPLPQVWNWRGLRLIGKDPSILERAEPTKFLEVVKELVPEVEVWTCQPLKWRPYTERWLAKNLGGKLGKVVYTGNPLEKERLLSLEGATYLVDDYPFFQNWERIILISYPYNSGAEARIRIEDAEQLRNLLQRRQG